MKKHRYVHIAVGLMQKQVRKGNQFKYHNGRNYVCTKRIICRLAVALFADVDRFHFVVYYLPDSTFQPLKACLLTIFRVGDPIG